MLKNAVFCSLLENESIRRPALTNAWLTITNSAGFGGSAAPAHNYLARQATAEFHGV